MLTYGEHGKLQECWVPPFCRGAAAPVATLAPPLRCTEYINCSCQVPLLPCFPFHRHLIATMDDVGLPKASVVKAIKELMPEGVRVAGDANDLLLQCCNQFVHLISTQANDISEREKRSTISPEHVVKALEELEFGPQYIEAVKAGGARAPGKGG